MSKKSKKRNERIEVLEQKDIKKQNKVLFETKQCFCCGEIFEVYPYIEKNPEHIASNNLPWMPYGSYFIKVEDFTALQYGVLCSKCTEAPLAKRVKTISGETTDKLNSENEEYNQQKNLIR